MESIIIKGNRYEVIVSPMKRNEYNSNRFQCEMWLMRGVMREHLVAISYDHTEHGAINQMNQVIIDMS